MPVGSRKRNISPREPTMSRGKLSRNEPCHPVFDPVEWKDWKPKTREETEHQFMSAIKFGVAYVKNMMESFRDTIGDEEYEHLRHYRDLMDLMIDYFSGEEKRQINLLKLQLEENMEALIEILGEDRSMKAILKSMAELEVKIYNYCSERATKKYRNVQKRMIMLSGFKPFQQAQLFQQA